jgi:hypothetical protein
MSTKDEYAAAYKSLITCIAARVPVVLWGPPGQGKTSVIKQIAADQNRHLEVILASIREPQDFAGLPMLSQGVATLMPPDWAKRLAEVKDGIVTLQKSNIKSTKERGGNRVSRYKINPLFFIRTKDISFHDSNASFKLESVRQLNPSITAKMKFNGLKIEEVRNFYLGLLSK